MGRAARRAKERRMKRTRRPKIGCKTASERIAKNAVSYLGRSWCDTFRSCKRSTGRRNRSPKAMPEYWKNAKYAVGWLRKNSRKVLSWKRKGRKARRVRRVVRTSWHVAGLQCKTARVSSNRAGVIRSRQWRGWTMVGGGINNKYRHFNRLSAFEESYPEGTNWRCDTGFGPGRLDCYSRQCRLGGMSCTTRRAYKNGSGTATAYLPAGYVATGGGMYNHYRAWNRKAAFETSMPVGNRAWRCDMGLGAGRFSCYVRGCR